MKNQSVTIVTTQFEPVLEKFMQERDLVLQELARKNAKHYAKKNLPTAIGDFLPPYVEEVKSGYEKLDADAQKHLLSSSHLAQGKMDIEHYQSKEKNIVEEIDKKEAQIHNAEFELGDFQADAVSKRINIALALALCMALGEIIFNAKAFQIIGDNLLMALFMSLCITTGVLVFSHFTASKVKTAVSLRKKVLIAIGSLSSATALFIVLGIFRSKYLAEHQVQISPVFFVIINLFLFIVSCIISYYAIPTWKEIKEDRGKLKLSKLIQKLRDEIVLLNEQRKVLQQELQESLKMRLRVMHYSHYITELIKKMYKHAAGIFKGTNLTYRSDGKVPDSFHHSLPELDITNNAMNQINQNRKAS